MDDYENLSGKSGVLKYKTGVDFILIQFIDHSIYEYNYQATGKGNVEKMKQLASSGIGLNTFISQKIRTRFSKKIR